MLAKLIRLLSAALIGAIGVWWGRQVAHSKTPPPQGQWREISEAELRHKGDNSGS
ncbi:hypothetical protein BH20ACT23_BH20ACT23_12830 [soil metagenome]